jgi:hypothetical protein
MNEAKLNCWEFKKCGRGPGGENTSVEICPAAVDSDLDGIHQGQNAGRSCWVIASTFCGEQLQVDSGGKGTGCLFCDFYKLVRQEEFPYFMLTPFILERKKKKKD